MRNLKLISLGLAIGLIIPAGAVALEAPDSPATTSQEDSAPVYVPLREVLPELSEQTGIEFQVPESLQDEMIPWQEEGGEDGSPSTDWVRDHSRVELWDEQTGDRKIILMDSNSGSAPSRPVTYTPRKTKQINTPDKPKPTLSREKAVKLGGALPPAMIRAWKEDLRYRDFISSTGVHYAGELNVEVVAERVRGKARKLLDHMKTEPWDPSPLSREEAEMLGGVHRNSLQDLWQDQEYRAFFTGIGVNGPRDLISTSTVIKVRKEARKQLHPM